MSGEPKSDLELAEALVAAVDPLDEEKMILVENTIFERLDVPLDETEQGPTASAIARLEEFVSKNIGRPWTYAESSR